MKTILVLCVAALIATSATAHTTVNTTAQKNGKSTRHHRWNMHPRGFMKKYYSPTF